MAALSTDCLRLLNEKIRRSQLFPDDENFIFLVIEVQRYLVDPDFTTHTGLDVTRDTFDLFDVTITDNVNKLKCLLNPNLNHLAQGNELHVGSLISIQPSKCHIHINDQILTAEPCVILDHMEILTDYSDNTINPELLTFCSSAQKEDVPLVTGRGTYLPLWNNEDPTGRLWKTLEPSSQTDKSEKCRIAISELALNWKTHRFSNKQLIVRVLNKVRLRMFGKKDKRDKWPFQLYLIVGDHTGVCTIVIWGALCLDLFNSISEGTVLLISSFKVRQRFQFMTQPTSRVQLTTYDIEVNLDKNNPPAEINIVPVNDVLDQWDLPSLQASFFNCRQLSSLPDQFNCDIVGTVIHVGRYNRIRKATDNQFWSYRWMHLMDSSSPQPIIVQLFSTSQPEIQNLIFPGSIIILTQMRLMHSLENITNSRQKRLLYVTTNNESQVTLYSENDSSPWFKHDAVKDVCEWSKSASCQQLLQQKASFGGYEDYSYLPDNMEAFKQMNEDSTLELTSASALCGMLSSICYRETMRIKFQGLLFNVQYNCPAQRESHYLRSSQTRTSSVFSEMSQALIGKAAVCGQKMIHQMTFRRAFSLKGGADVYMKHMAMPRGLYDAQQVKQSKHELTDIPTGPPEDYLTVMISSLNYDVAIFAHFLLPETLPQDVCLEEILSGKAESYISCGVVGEERTQTINRIVLDSSVLIDKRMMFVLDAYQHLGCEELIIKRAYLIDK